MRSWLGSTALLVACLSAPSARHAPATSKTAQTRTDVVAHTLVGRWISGDRTWTFFPAGDYAYADTAGSEEGNWRLEAREVVLEKWSEVTPPAMVLDYDQPKQKAFRVGACEAGEGLPDCLQIAGELWSRQGKQLDFGFQGSPIPYVDRRCEPLPEESKPCKAEGERCYAPAWSSVECDAKHAYFLCREQAWRVETQRVPCVP